MQLYGIIGFPLEHSFSPRYFNEKFHQESIDAFYRTFEIREAAEIREILNTHPNLRGVNVTIPYKQAILPYLNAIDPVAKDIKAVNCVKITTKKGKPFLTGYNTDVYGFLDALLDFIPWPIPKALILGNGGAAKAIRYVLPYLGIDFLTVSRTPRVSGEIGYSEVSRFLPDHRLIINTTPLGTWPHTADCPNLPYEALTPNHYLFDLVYNPEITTFMQKGQQQGAKTCNGYAMLTSQAEMSCHLSTK